MGNCLDCMPNCEFKTSQSSQGFWSKMVRRMKNALIFLLVAIITIYTAAIYGIIECIAVFIYRVYKTLVDFINFEG